MLSLLAGVEAGRVVVLAATKKPEVDPDLVTPGVVGFVTMLLIAVVTLLLIFDMVRRVRRVRYRAEITAKLDAEEAEQRGEQRAENGEQR